MSEKGPKWITAAEVSDGVDMTQIDDLDGKKAIDFDASTVTGRSLYSNDGITKMLNWGNVDTGMVSILIGRDFDWAVVISMVDPATFSPSSNTTDARAQISTNFLFADVLKLTPSASPPVTANEGDIYAGTDHHLYYFNGTDWKQLDN